jgi:hypothetical protein
VDGGAKVTANKAIPSSVVGTFCADFFTVVAQIMMFISYPQ